MFVKSAEWVESSLCDSYQRELSRNIFDSNLESSRCDSNLQNFCAQLINFKIIFALSIFGKVFTFKVFH